MKGRRRRLRSTPLYPRLLLQSNQKTSSASYLSEIRINSKQTKRQNHIRWSVSSFLLFVRHLTFTSGIFFHCLPPPPNQLPQWLDHRSKKHTCDLLLPPTSDKLHCLLSCPHLQLWRAAATLNLLPAQTCSLPKSCTSRIFHPISGQNSLAPAAGKAATSSRRPHPSGQHTRQVTIYLNSFKIDSQLKGTLPVPVFSLSLFFF